MARKYNISEEDRRARSERMKQRHKDSAFAAKIAAAARETMQRQQANPAFEAKRIAGVKRKRVKVAAATP